MRLFKGLQLRVEFVCLETTWGFVCCKCHFLSKDSIITNAFFTVSSSLSPAPEYNILGAKNVLKLSLDFLFTMPTLLLSSL